MNLDFLTVPAGADAPGTDAPVARSTMETSARAAGARLEVRDGWSVAVGYGATAAQEAAAAAETVGWADVSHLGKLEVQGPPAALERIAAVCEASIALGEARRHAGAWWCQITGDRLLVIGDVDAVRERLREAADGDGVSVLDVTTKFAAMTLVGPQARETFARFCALDLRPEHTPVCALRPGSIGRQPAILVCEAENRYLFLFGWASGEYMWTVVADAAEARVNA